MTFTDSTYAVDGAEITGRLYRLELMSSTYRQTGIIQPTDLEVRELSTPGTSVRILAGACVILGDAVDFQGSYFGYNVGQEDVPIASTGSGETRSDLVIVQAHDSTYTGSPFPEDPATDRIVYPEVIPNVGPTATTTSEPNAIVLARIDMPESTGTVTQDLITDLRFPLIMSPYFQDSVRHGDAQEPLGLAGVDGGFHTPPAGTTSVTFPSWATRVDIHVVYTDVLFDELEGDAPNNMWGRTRIVADGTPLAGFGHWNVEWPGGKSNKNIHNGGTHDATPFQGQTVDLEFQMDVQGKSGNEGVFAGYGTTCVWQVFFRQEPEFNF